MARICVFCDRPADSREHVLPAWIARHLDAEALWSDGRGSVGVDPHPVSMGDFKARVLCGERFADGGCNRHFADLERDVKSTLTWLMTGRPLQMDGSTRELVARWAFKTAVTVLATRPAMPGVPRRDALAFRTSGRPPRTAAVMVGHYDPGDARFLAAGRLLASRMPAWGQGLPDGAYFLELALDHLVLMVFGVDDRPGEGAPFGCDVNRLLPLWPQRAGLLSWPPPVSFTALDEVERLPQERGRLIVFGGSAG